MAWSSWLSFPVGIATGAAAGVSAESFYEDIVPECGIKLVDRLGKGVLKGLAAAGGHAAGAAAVNAAFGDVPSVVTVTPAGAAIHGTTEAVLMAFC
jgi:hypothetical protein